MYVRTYVYSCLSGAAARYCLRGHDSVMLYYSRGPCVQGSDVVTRVIINTYAYIYVQKQIGERHS